MKLTDIWKRIRPERDDFDEISYDHDGKLIELSARIEKQRKQRLRPLLIVLGVVLLCVILFFALYYRNTYTSYRVLGNYNRDDGGTGSYLEVNGTIIRYNADGVAGMDTEGNEIWQVSFEMDVSLSAVCGDSFALAEKEGRRILVFSSQGSKGEITTAYPIQMISVSAQGIVAAMMQDGNESILNLYDRAGTLLVESRSSVQNTGFPLSSAISEDGTRLLVSYIQMGESISSKVVCYRFSEDATEQDEYSILDITYEDLLIAKVGFTGNYTAYAVGDGKAVFFEGSEKMEEKKVITYSEEIQSVVQDTESLAIVTRKEKSGYTLQLLDKNGEERMSVDFSDEYSDIDMRDGQIFLMNGANCQIFKESGREIFSGTFAENIEAIFPLGGLNKYFIVSENSMQKIRLGR